MKKPPTRYSADGRWWWDGEQWKAVDTTPPATDDDGTYPSLRAAGSGHQRLVITVGLSVLVILIVLALWLVGTHLALPSSRATPTPIPTSAPRTTPRPTPSAAVQAAVATYRRAVASGVSTVGKRVATVDKDCAAPADLATCRSSLVALGSADARFRSSLPHPAPGCLAGADTQLRAAIGAMDQAEGTAVAGIDQGQPATIEGGLSGVGTSRQQLAAAAGRVDAATC